MSVVLGDGGCLNNERIRRWTYSKQTSVGSGHVSVVVTGSEDGVVVVVVVVVICI